ncbi:MAG: hypothetical protein HY748_16830 [Elusimicrobia bacterium]|nr:hypothetical protein [Elusimicrobiota bacterium]
MATNINEQEMTQAEALRIADAVVHSPDRTSQALVRLAADLRKAQDKVAALEACSQIVPMAGLVYEP